MKQYRAFFRGLILGAIIILAAKAALAHSWYSASCCSGKDCAAVPIESATWTPEGWIVELQPGDHPMVITHAIRELVPFAKERISQDGDFHACVRTEAAVMDRVICLYVPDGRFGS
jgi:hypothetical protein